MKAITQAAARASAALAASHADRRREVPLRNGKREPEDRKSFESRINGSLDMFVPTWRHDHEWKSRLRQRVDGRIDDPGIDRIRESGRRVADGLIDDSGAGDSRSSSLWGPPLDCRFG